MRQLGNRWSVEVDIKDESHVFQTDTKEGADLLFAALYNLNPTTLIMWEGPEPIIAITTDPTTGQKRKGTQK